MECGRRLFRHAKMFERTDGLIARFAEPARDGSCDQAQKESSKLVSRREYARELLGTGTRLSSYRADLDELRAARSVAVGHRRRFDPSLEAARAGVSRF